MTFFSLEKNKFFLLSVAFYDVQGGSLPVAIKLSRTQYIDYHFKITTIYGICQERLLAINEQNMVKFF